MSGLPLVARGMAEHQRQVPPLGGFERAGLCRIGWGDRPAQDAEIEIRQGEVEHQCIELTRGDRLRSAGGARRRYGLMIGSAEQRDELLAPFAISIYYQELQRLHA